MYDIDCPACLQPADYCQGGHGDACPDCHGYTDAHTELACVAVDLDLDAPLMAMPWDTLDPARALEVLPESIGEMLYDTSRTGGAVRYALYVMTTDADGEPCLDATLAGIDQRDPCPDYVTTATDATLRVERA